jgi:hypothetical protein
MGIRILFAVPIAFHPFFSSPSFHVNPSSYETGNLPIDLELGEQLQLIH